MATRKLTPALLRRIVLEERQRVLDEKKLEMGLLDAPVEVDADEFGTDKVLEDPEDFTVKEAKRALRRIEMMERDEKALLSKLKSLREAKTKAMRKFRK